MYWHSNDTARRQGNMETGPRRLAVLLSGVLVLTLHAHLLLGDPGSEVETGLKFWESPFQGVETIRLVDCTADMMDIVSLRMYGNNETRLVFARNSKEKPECTISTLLSSCQFGPQNKVRLQVLVSDNTTRSLSCCLCYSGRESVQELCRSINVTIPEKTALTPRDAEREVKVTTLSNIGSRETDGSSGLFDEGTSTIVIIVMASLFVIFIAMFVALLCVFIRVWRRKETAAPRDFELLSFRRSFGGDGLDGDCRTLKRHVSCPPPSGLAPDVPGGVMVMPYQMPLPLSPDGTPYREDRSHVSGSVGQYQEPWGYIPGEISNGLSTFRPVNPNVRYVPGFEGTMTRENLAALLEDCQ